MYDKVILVIVKFVWEVEANLDLKRLAIKHNVVYDNSFRTPQFSGTVTGTGTGTGGTYETWSHYGEPTGSKYLF